MHVLKAYAYLDVDRHHYVEIDGWMDDGRWTKGWRDGWMDGWMDAWMAQSMQILPTHQDLRHEPAFFTKLYDGSNGLLQPSAVCFKRRAWIHVAGSGFRRSVALGFREALQRDLVQKGHSLGFRV